jgi:hypothetical protein
VPKECRVIGEEHLTVRALRRLHCKLGEVRHYFFFAYHHMANGYETADSAFDGCRAFNCLIHKNNEVHLFAFFFSPTFVPPSRPSELFTLSLSKPKMSSGDFASNNEDATHRRYRAT